jgi:hypothetical protein
MNKKGFALVSVLVLGFVISLIGGAAFLVAKNGFLITGSGVRYNIAEKAADYGINYYIDGYTANKSPFADNQCDCPNDNYCVCTLKPNPNSKDPVATVRIISLNNTFIIHSTGTYNGATVVKIASANTVLKTIPNIKNKGKIIANIGAVMMPRITGLTSGSSASSIAACDENCPAAAMILGSPLPKSLKVPTSKCSNGETELDSSILIKDGSDGKDPLTPSKIYSTYFNGVSSRSDLINKLQSMYSITFNESLPDKFRFASSNSIRIAYNNLPARGSSYDLCDFEGNLLGEALASGNTITTQFGIPVSFKCQAHNTKLTFTWDGSKYAGRLDCYESDKTVSITTFYCNKINFGSTVRILNFSGGGGLSAFSFDIQGDINGSPLTLVGRRGFYITGNNVNINSPVYIFTPWFFVDANNLHINSSSMVVSFGTTTYNIHLEGNSNIGTQDNPVLMISDSGIHLSGYGSHVINGLIFSTDKNSSLYSFISGNYTINGSVGSTSSDNSMYLEGKINFDSKILQNLSEKFSDLIKPPQCGTTITVPVVSLTDTQKINFKTTIQTLY